MESIIVWYKDIRTSETRSLAVATSDAGNHQWWWCSKEGLENRKRVPLASSGWCDGASSQVEPLSFSTHHLLMTLVGGSSKRKRERLGRRWGRLGPRVGRLDGLGTFNPSACGTTRHIRGARALDRNYEWPVVKLFNQSELWSGLGWGCLFGISGLRLRTEYSDSERDVAFKHFLSPRYWRWGFSTSVHW